ncbi:hypothetical protein KY284_015654 [Solanum tuberosum]|nr:hypothetical protein KY284_015654 [Solanum tuberosum]
MSIVWDPGQLGCVKSNWFKVFSIVNKCNALTCPLIAYSLVIAEYYVVQHDILVANFQQTSVLHHCSRWHGTGVGVLVERFGRRRALTTIAQYFEVNNCSIDKSMHLSNNETTMSIVLQVANEAMLTNLTIRRDAHTYSNLEDKVLIGVGSIVMNGPRPVLAKRPNTELSGYVWDPG